jgi:hypothetical protein
MDIVEWREDDKASWRTFECDLEVVNDGEGLAEWIIRDRLSFDPANWEDYDGQVEIRAPEQFAGLYEISIDFEPTVNAVKLEG